jgi:hypothetical protein
MSKQPDNESPLDKTPDLKSSLKSAKQVAYLSLVISLMVFLFGDDIVGRMVGHIKTYSPWFLTSVNGLEGTIAIFNVLLAAFVLWDPKTRQAIKTADIASTLPSAKDSFRKLMLGWRLLWLFRMLLYVWLGAHWFGLHNFVSSKLTWYIASALHLLVGFFHYFLFFVLDIPSVATESRPNSAIVFRRSISTILVFGGFVFIASALVNYSTPSEAGITNFLAHKLIPTYAGIGMAFLIGRLDSHYLRIPRIMLAPMYLYVIVQPLWSRVAGTDFQNVNAERAAIFALVLTLKFVFFYAVAEWIRNGGFLQYLIKIERDRNRLAS